MTLFCPNDDFLPSDTFDRMTFLRHDVFGQMKLFDKVTNLPNDFFQSFSSTLPFAINEKVIRIERSKIH